MARTRSRSGAAPGAPRPKIEPRYRPLRQRPVFRWIKWGGAGLVALLVLLFVLGRMGRSNDLKAYDRALAEAQQPYTKHLEQSATLPFATLPSQFVAGQATPKQLKDAATTWAADFTTAARQVETLETKTPGPIKAANEELSRALDLYAGVATLYGSMADLRLQMEDLTAKQRTPLQDRFAAALQQVLAVKGGADQVYQHAIRQITELKIAWGLQEPAPDPTIPPNLPIPDGGPPG